MCGAGRGAVVPSTRNERSRKNRGTAGVGVAPVRSYAGAFPPRAPAGGSGSSHLSSLAGHRNYERAKPGRFVRRRSRLGVAAVASACGVSDGRGSLRVPRGGNLPIRAAAVSTSSTSSSRSVHPAGGSQHFLPGSASVMRVSPCTRPHCPGSSMSSLARGLAVRPDRGCVTGAGIVVRDGSNSRPVRASFGVHPIRGDSRFFRGGWCTRTARPIRCPQAEKARSDV